MGGSHQREAWHDDQIIVQICTTTLAVDEVKIVVVALSSHLDLWTLEFLR